MGSFWGKLTNGSDALDLQLQPQIERKSQSKLQALEKAQQMIRLVAHITSAYQLKVDALLKKDESLVGEGERQANDVEIQKLIVEWEGKVRALGGEPKGIWKADFDAGDGYFCWSFPDRTIRHWHRYTDGFTGRIPVEVWATEDLV